MVEGLKTIALVLVAALVASTPSVSVAGPLEPAVNPISETPARTTDGFYIPITTYDPNYTKT